MKNGPGKKIFANGDTLEVIFIIQGNIYRRYVKWTRKET